MRPWLAGVSACALLAGALAGQSPLRLKNLQAWEAAGLRAEPAPPARERSWSEGRRHVLAELAEDVTAEQIGEWRQRGIRFVQYVPDRGLVLSVERDFRLEGSGLARADSMRPEYKMSPVLEEDNPAARQDHVLVELHPDVDPRIGRLIAADLGYQVLDHPDLLPTHLLVRAPAAEALRLAEWDEVAYVLPASSELVEGEPVEACHGALTAGGPVGQYVATVGEGWDGPGLGSAQLGYHFERLTGKLPGNLVRAEVLRALAEWSRAASLRFLEAQSPHSPRTLNFLFGAGEHGDGHPFDGPGRVLAHTFYPAPPNPEPIAGDVHLDDEEEWVTGPDLSARSADLFTVSLHELGHALGLGHSDQPGSVMYPYYRRATALTQEDTRAIRTLYAAPAEAPPAAPLSLAITTPAVFPLTTEAASLSLSGTTSGGSGGVLVTWTSDRAGAGVAQGSAAWHIPSIPLYLGGNRITISATGASGAAASRTVEVARVAAAEKPALSILSPTTDGAYESRSASITLSGTAWPAPAIVRVEWSSSAGGSGVASGTSSWSAGPIPLQAGGNLLTVSARDANGASASRTLLVTYTPATADTVAPSLRITSPAATSVLVASPVIRLQGTATDNVGVTEVTWSTSSNRSGRATGASYWTTGDIPLLVGTNVVVVRAYDAAGNSSWRSLTVTRR